LTERYPRRRRPIEATDRFDALPASDRSFLVPHFPHFIAFDRVATVAPIASDRFTGCEIIAHSLLRAPGRVFKFLLPEMGGEQAPRQIDSEYG